MLIDENDLRAGLRSLAAGAPPQPPDREARSVRRAAGIRRRRAALTAVAVVVPLVAVGAVVARPQQRGDLTSVANWPDRTPASLRATVDEAVASWRADGNDLRPGESVKRLYAGDAVAPGGPLVVAFATCDGDACSRAVLTVGHPPPPPAEGRSWEHATRTLTPGVPFAPLSAYVPVDDEDPRNGPRTAVFVLAAPGATGATYASPARRRGTGGEGALDVRADGAFGGVVGYLSAPVTVTVNGENAFTGTVGEPGAVGFTRWLPDEQPEGYESLGVGAAVGTGGQLREPRRRLTAGDHDAPFLVLAVCAGTGPVRVTLAGATRTVSCDGRPHEATGVVRPSPDHAVELAADDPYTAYQLWFVSPRSG